MARAYGWNARTLIAFENEYGTVVTGGNYYLIPFVSSSLDSEQGLIESSVVGIGRDPSQPFQDAINVDGDIVVPIDLRNIGYWLKATFGEAIVTGDSVYQHQFSSGQMEIPSLSIEMGLADVPDYPLFTGVRVNSIAFNFQRSGEAQLTISLMGQGETSATTTMDTNPSEMAYSRFSQFQGAIKQGDDILANVTSASLNYNNNLEKVETIRSDGKIGGLDIGMTSLIGSISVRYADTDLMNKARNGDPIDLELSYIINDDKKLVLKAHEVYLPKPKRTIDGPGGIEISYDFQGANNNSLNKMFTIILTNDVEEY